MNSWQQTDLFLNLIARDSDTSNAIQRTTNNAHIRELVISPEATGPLALYRCDLPLDVVRIFRVPDQRW